MTDCKSCITTHNDMDTVSVPMLHNIVGLTAVKAINRKFSGVINLNPWVTIYNLEESAKLIFSGHTGIKS